ncbi:MAG: CHAP domain-containing protein [Eubacterium sp.]
MKFTKETAIRMLRTFIQTAIGYITVNLAGIDFTGDRDMIKTALIGLALSATSAGIAALMNLQPSEEKGAGGNMGFDEFVKAYMGKSIDYDGVSGVQCVDLVKVYMNKVFGLKPGAWGNAKDYYENFNNISALKNNFTRIANTPEFVPQKGDICVWGRNVSSSHNYGHIAIATGEGNTKELYTYDQNWNGKAMKKVKHNYIAFLGVLRPKNQTPFTAASNPFKKGNVYTLTVDVKVREAAGTNAKWKTVSQLTEDGKKNATSKNANDYAVLKTGTRVTVQELKTLGSDIWAKIPSGYICLRYNGKNYVK